MLAGDILPAVKDDNRRSEIFDRICTVEHMISSIYMCIENSKWLEPGVRILKELLPNNGKGSIAEQFRALHNRQANMKVQTSEFTSEDRTLPSGNSFWMSYRQIFLFSLRHFPEMDGQAPRKDVAKQSSPHPGIQRRWWHELSSLASESGYRGLRRKYQDRKAADAKAIEDCVRSILPPKYYQIDSARMRRIVQLNCQLMSDVPYAERMKVVPELTSDHDGCGPDISDRCGRPYNRSLQADQESLFLDHVYLNSYSSIPKRYLTSFAVKRDFFYSFFGSEEDDLDPQPRLETPRDDIAMDEDKDEHTDEVLADREHTTPSEEIDAGVVNPNEEEIQSVGQLLSTSGNLSDTMEEEDHVTPSEEINAGVANPDEEEFQLAGQSLSTLGNLSDTKEEEEIQPQSSGVPPPMRVFNHQNHDAGVSLAEASRLLSKTWTGRRKQMFTVLSPLAGNRFRKRQADSRDNASMVAALELPSESRFMARDNNKRLKMTAPTAILNAARSEQLQTVLMVKQPNVQELIRRFEDHVEPEEPEEELDEIT
jgi:hypothetical protein